MPQTSQEPQRPRYLRIRYRGPAFEAGAAGRPGMPAPGTTFSRLDPDFLAPATSWLEPEDRAAYQADLAYAREAASKMRKSDLRYVMEASGMTVLDRETKDSLVLRSVGRYMEQRWPVMVVG